MDENLVNKILEKSKAIEEKVIKYRRQIHKHPEVKYEEHKTADLAANTMEDLGIEVKRHVGDLEKIKETLKSLGEEPSENVGSTGVVGILHGEQGEGKTVLLRADMDALPLPETEDPDHIPNQEGFGSENDGVMHACGHDAHVAMLLGAAEVLSEMTEHFNGTIKFLFQPAEEGWHGGKILREAGVVDDVDAAFGIHVWSPLEKGMIQINDGPQMASVDKLHLEVEGGGGHGSAPHETKDPLSTASDIMNAYYEMADREIDTLKPSVISICRLESGTTWNVIPSIARMQGTIRTFDSDVRDYMITRAEEIGTKLADIHGLEFNFKDYYIGPPTVNSEPEAALAREAAGEVFGEGKVVQKSPIMGGEDFAFYLEKVPGAFMFLGVRDEERGITAPHHNEKFDLDESQLYKGVALHTAVALKFLE